MRRGLDASLCRNTGQAHLIDCSLECVSTVVLREAVAPSLSVRRKLVVSIQQQFLEFLIILARPKVDIVASTVGTVFLFVANVISCGSNEPIFLTCLGVDMRLPGISSASDYKRHVTKCKDRIDAFQPLG